MVVVIRCESKGKEKLLISPRMKSGLTTAHDLFVSFSSSSRETIFLLSCDAARLLRHPSATLLSETRTNYFDDHTRTAPYKCSVFK